MKKVLCLLLAGLLSGVLMLQAAAAEEPYVKTMEEYEPGTYAYNTSLAGLQLWESGSYDPADRTNGYAVVQGEDCKYLEITGSGYVQTPYSVNHQFTEDIAVVEVKGKIDQNAYGININVGTVKAKSSFATKPTVPESKRMGQNSGWITVRLVLTKDGKYCAYVDDDMVTQLTEDASKADAIKAFFPSDEAPDAKLQFWRMENNYTSGTKSRKMQIAQVRAYSVAPGTPEKLTVSGQSTLAIPSHTDASAASAAYTVQASDILGNALSSIQPEWSLKTPAEGVSVDNSGTLSVTNVAAPGTVTLTATASGKTADYTVTLEAAGTAGLAERNIRKEYHVDGDAIQVGVVGTDNAVPGFSPWDNAKSQTPAADKFFVALNGPAGETDKCFQMKAPAYELAEGGAALKNHQVDINNIYLNELADTFVVEFKVKFDSVDNDALRLDVWACDSTGKANGKQFGFTFSDKADKNLYNKPNIGQWNTIKLVFNRADHAFCVIVNDFPSAKVNLKVSSGDVKDDIWQYGLAKLRFTHGGASAGTLAADNTERSMYLDDIVIYEPKSLELSALYTTYSDTNLGANVLNLVDGKAGGVAMKDDTLTVRAGFINPTATAKKVKLLAAVYKDGVLLKAAMSEDITVPAGGSTLATPDKDNTSVINDSRGNLYAFPLVLPSTTEGCTLRVFALADVFSMIPVEYARIMQGGFYNFKVDK